MSARLRTLPPPTPTPPHGSQSRSRGWLRVYRTVDVAMVLVVCLARLSVPRLAMGPRAG